MTREENQIIGALIKWAVLSFVGLIALVAAIALAAYAYNWLTYERHKQALRIAVAWTAYQEKPPITCTTEFPIAVGFVNNSSRTVRRIAIGVEGFLPDHSTNILQYDSVAAFDRIVLPGEGWAQCWRFQFKPEYASDPQKPNATYAGRIQSVEFE